MRLLGRFLYKLLLILASTTTGPTFLQGQVLFVPDELLVKFKLGTPRSVVDQVNNGIGAVIVGTFRGDPDLYQVKLQPNANPDDAIDRYHRDPNVIHAEKNLIVSVPEDPRLPARWGFGESFDDLADGSSFFSLGGTGQRWAVAENGNSRCDLPIRTFQTVQSIYSSPDRVVEVQYFGRAGAPGSDWTIASSKAPYPPVGEGQTVTIRVATADGSTFRGKSGRIGVGFIGQTGLVSKVCSQTSLSYDQHSFRASIVGGIQLDDARPFWALDPPFTEQIYAPIISTQDLTKMTISISFTAQDFTLRILDPDTGAQIFSATSPYPLWSWSGTHARIFTYYGVTDGTTGALYVRDFLSTRP